MLDANLVLKTSGAETSSTNGTGVNFGNVVVNQPITFVVNITAVSGTTPTLDLKIQGSPDNSTWTTIHQFPQKTAVAYGLRAQHKGGGYKYFRYASTIAGTTPSFTYSVYPELGGEYTSF